MLKIIFIEINTGKKLTGGEMHIAPFTIKHKFYAMGFSLTRVALPV